MDVRVISIWVDDSDLPLSHLRAHLLSLRRQCVPASVPLLLIVDEGRDPGVVEADLWSGVTLLHVPRAQIWAERATALAEGPEVVVLTTSRAIVEEGWLAALSAALMDGSQSAGGVVDTTALNNPYEGTAQDVIGLPAPFGRGPVPWHHNVAYRVDAAAAVGGLCAELTGWAQDIDLHWRLHGDPRIVPGARVLLRRPRAALALFQAGVREGVRDAALLEKWNDPALIERYIGSAPPVLGAARRVTRVLHPRLRHTTVAQIGLVAGRLCAWRNSGARCIGNTP